jgi:hypothetical protein
MRIPKGAELEFVIAVEHKGKVVDLQVLLRELSRDMLEAVRALFGSTSFPSIPVGRLQSLSTSNPNAFGAVQRLRAASIRAATVNDSNGGEDAEKHPATSYNSIPWDQTVAHALMAVC